MHVQMRWALPVLLLIVAASLPIALEALGPEGRELRAQLGFLSTLLIWAIYALSYNLLYGLTGLLSFAHAIFLGAGALTVGIAAAHFGAGLWVALGVGVLISTLLAATLGTLLVQVRGMGFVVVTAAVALITSLLVVFYGDWTGGVSGLRLPRESLDLGIGTLTLLQRNVSFWLNLTCCALVLLGFYALTRTQLGLALKLVRENEIKAKLIGYRTQWLKWTSFVISGALAGGAGALLALTQGSMNAGLFNWTHSIDALAWVVVGGAGTIWGPLLGVGVLQGIEHSFGNVIPIGPSALSGILLIVIVLLAPKGIVGLVRKLRERGPNNA